MVIFYDEEEGRVLQAFIYEGAVNRDKIADIHFRTRLSEVKFVGERRVAELYFDHVEVRIEFFGEKKLVGCNMEPHDLASFEAFRSRLAVTGTRIHVPEEKRLSQGLQSVIDRYWQNILDHSFLRRHPLPVVSDADGTLYVIPEYLIARGSETDWNVAQYDSDCGEFCRY